MDPVPGGVDIRSANVGSDLQLALAPGSGAPQELSGWATEREILLWVDLYDPVPDPPGAYTEWLFALDLDGDDTTGFPAGRRRINPDLGYEATLGVSFDVADGEYVPYLLVWDPVEADWEAMPGVVRHIFSESRALVGLAVPFQSLLDAVAETTEVTAQPELARGRAAVLSYVGDQAVIDFYPDLPE